MASFGIRPVAHVNRALFGETFMELLETGTIKFEPESTWPLTRHAISASNPAMELRWGFDVLGPS